MVGPEGERHDDPVDKFGIPQALFDMQARFSRLPGEAYGFASGMTSHLLEEDLAQAYLVSRPQRLEVARIFKELGVKGKQLGQVMRDLHTLATGNAKPRRK